MGAVDVRACWTCGFQKIGGHLTFLGNCGWFETKDKPAKPIPPTVVDVGCKFHIVSDRKARTERGDDATEETDA